MQKALIATLLIYCFALCCSAADACGPGGCGINNAAPFPLQASGHQAGKKPSSPSGKPIISSAIYDRHIRQLPASGPGGVTWSHTKYLTGRPITLYPEKTIWIRLSSTDLNRIVCLSGKITDARYSQEKGVKIDIVGNQAYLKLMALRKSDGTVEYSKTPVDVYLSCGGETYGFIGRPYRIPSRTIYLVDTQKREDETKRAFAADTVEEAVTQILGDVFKNKIPRAWEKAKIRYIPDHIKSLPALKLRELHDWRIPGVNILVRVVEIFASSQTRLLETNFLQPELTINPIAISLEKKVLMPGESSRVVYLEKE